MTLNTCWSKLSESHRAIWIDQLSIPQTSQKEIRTHLERIPQIYGTLEVVIILPNAPCHCLQESLDAYEQGTAFLAKDGDFDLLEVSNLCISAIPLCSYYLRLWTKQEFTYAKTVSVQCASASKVLCSRHISSRWMVKSNTLSHLHWIYMNTFLRRCYEAFSSEAAVFGDQANDVTWSQFQILIDGVRSALGDGVHLFHMVGQAEEHDLYLTQHIYLYTAKFLLGQRLERQSDDDEGQFIHFTAYNSRHRATVENDFALAVFPGHNAYRIPQDWQVMALPDLVDDGFSQLQRHHFERFLTSLPKGLFIFEAGSATAKPSYWMGKHQNHTARDIYGPLKSSSFRCITNQGSIAIRIRDRNSPFAARMIRSVTYETAFMGKSTDDVLVFMKKLSKPYWHFFGPGTHTLESWAVAVLSGFQPAPQGRWPSRDHELAVFRECLHSPRGWEGLPEINHYDACYSLMCSWAGIRPSTARERELGLVVALEDPPYMGLFNGTVHEGLQTIEDYQKQYGVPDAQDRNINNAILPEQWLTVMMDDYKGSLSRTKKWPVYEAFVSDRSFDPAWVGQPPRHKQIPIYSVVGVWYHGNPEDRSIGAELASRWSDERLAVLM